MLENGKVCGLNIKNDPLKAKAMGFKKDYSEKNISPEKNAQYYPKDKNGILIPYSIGVVDEWRAMLSQQNQMYEQAKVQEKSNKANFQHNY